MFILKGHFVEESSYVSKKDNTVVKQAVIYSDGDGVTYKISGIDTSKMQKFAPVEIPCVVGVYDGKLYVRKLDI